MSDKREHYWVQTQQGPKQCGICDKCDDPTCCDASTCDSVWPSRERIDQITREIMEERRVPHRSQP